MQINFLNSKFDTIISVASVFIFQSIKLNEFVPVTSQLNPHPIVDKANLDYLSRSLMIFYYASRHLRIQYLTQFKFKQQSASFSFRVLLTST